MPPTTRSKASEFARSPIGFIGSLSKQRGIRSYLTLVFFAGATSLMSFIAATILARKLGPSGFGRFSVFYSIVVIFWTATNFGDAAYVRYVNADPRADSRTYLRASVWIELGAAALLAMLAFPLASILAHWVFGKEQYFLAILIGILVGASLNLLSLVASTHQATERFTRYATLNSVYYTLTLISVVALVLIHPDIKVWMVYTLYGALGATMFVLSLLRLRRMARPLRIEGQIVRKLLSFGKWLIAANLAYLIYQRMDILFVARYVSSQTVGQYGVALRIGVIASLFTGSVAPFLLPKATRVLRSSDEMTRYLKRAGILILSLLGCIALLWLAVPLLVRLLFGDQYLAAIPLARVLLLGNVCIAIYTPLAQLFLAEDAPRKMFYMGMVKLIATTVLLVLLVSHHGARGGAWAVAISEFVTMTYVIFAMRRAIFAQIRLSTR